MPGKKRSRAVSSARLNVGALTTSATANAAAPAAAQPAALRIDSGDTISPGSMRAQPAHAVLEEQRQKRGTLRVPGPVERADERIVQRAVAGERPRALFDETRDPAIVEAPLDPRHGQRRGHSRQQ